MDDKVILEVKTSRVGEETVEAMVQLLASLTNLKKTHLAFIKRGIPISFEIAVIDQVIYFYVVISRSLVPFMESQIYSQYPNAQITQLQEDYIGEILKPTAPIKEGQLRLSYSRFLPLKTYINFKEIDPLSSLLGILSKLAPEDRVVIQYLLVPIGSHWQSEGHSEMNKKTTSADGTSTSNPHSAAISEKISQHGFRVGIRLLVKSINKDLFVQIATSFSGFNNASGNSLYLRKPYLWQKERLHKAFITRSKSFIPTHQILNLAEIATMFHFPTKPLSTIHNISWAKIIFSDAPENLPVATNLSDDEKKEINFFARTYYRNVLATFGMKQIDRRKHTYIIGKTGVGKSTLIANMVINDIRNGQGLAVIDPHGDLCETILDYIPSYRLNDVVYLSPTESSGVSFRLNPLEAQIEQKDLVASGIVAIFFKLYGNSWGPRLEYILRNTILTLLEVPNATMLLIPKILTDQRYRTYVVNTYLTDPVIRDFWLNEFDKMQPRMMVEATSPILNKVGQFLSSNVIRNIVGYPKSTIDLEDIMNNGKILLFNLSQGKMGEDNSALLGAMTITKLQLAAMNRVHIPEPQRRDFFLYVDEFQNFATTSFIKILSEARKYRLNLSLANQYMAQLPPELKSAIFGNVGTLITFLVGAEDVDILAKEFSERYKAEDILALGNHQIITRLSIDGMTSSPFLATTLPLPHSSNQNRPKVIRGSVERYYKKNELNKIDKSEITPTLTEGNSSVQNTRPQNQPPIQDKKGQTPPISDHTQKPEQKSQNIQQPPQVKKEENSRSQSNRDQTEVKKPEHTGQKPQGQTYSQSAQQQHTKKETEKNDHKDKRPHQNMQNPHESGKPHHNAQENRKDERKETPSSLKKEETFFVK